MTFREEERIKRNRLTFEDLDIGDVFTPLGEKYCDVKFVKLSNLKEEDKPIPKRLPNAIALYNTHYIVFPQKYRVKKIKSITDKFTEDEDED